MRQVTILRTSTDNQGTLGILFTDSGFICRTGELPWRNNYSNISCIPEGKYLCKKYNSRKFGRTFIVSDVLNRSYILFHSGNYFGDSLQNYKTHSYGCILLGQYSGIMQNQKAIFISRTAVRQFLEDMNCPSFILTIQKRYK